MLRELLHHDESESLFEVVEKRRADMDKIVDRCCWQGCEIVTGILKYETQFQLEKIMASNDIKVRVTFTRDQLTGTKNPAGNEVLAGQVIFSKLRAAGVPVIGTLGVLAVEWGKLTIEHEDGLDGDEWHYTYEGKPVPPEWVERLKKPGTVLNLTACLAQQIAAELAADDEL